MICRLSFDDSDRFEEDSMCSWSSEPESICNNWRGWRKPLNGQGGFYGNGRKKEDGKLFIFFLICHLVNVLINN